MRSGLPERIDRSPVFFGVFRRYSFDKDGVRKTDDKTALRGDRGLAHAELIRAVGFDHCGLSVPDLADVCLVDGDHLIFSEGVGAVFSAVHRDQNAPVIFVSARDFHADPDGCGDEQHRREKKNLFLLQFKTAPFRKYSENFPILPYSYRERQNDFRFARSLRRIRAAQAAFFRFKFVRIPLLFPEESAETLIHFIINGRTRQSKIRKPIIVTSAVLPVS